MGNAERKKRKWPKRALLALVVSIVGSGALVASVFLYNQIDCARKVRDFGKWYKLLVDDLRKNPNPASGLPTDDLVIIDDIISETHVQCVPGPVVFATKSRTETSWDSTDTHDFPVLAALRIKEDLRRYIQKHRADKPSTISGGCYYVVAYKEAPWSFIVLIVNSAAEEGYDKVNFSFLSTRERSVPRPSPAPIDLLVKLRAGDPQLPVAERNIMLSTTYRSLFNRCSQAEELFDRDYWSVWELYEHHSTEIPRCIEECNCRVEFDSLKAVLWTSLHVEPTTVVKVDIAHPGTTGAHEISLKANEPWQEAHRHIVNAAFDDRNTPVRLVVK